MRVITIHDVDALLQYYGEDGWSGENYIPKNYTVPHET